MLVKGGTCADSVESPRMRSFGGAVWPVLLGRTPHLGLDPWVLAKALIARRLERPSHLMLYDQIHRVDPRRLVTLLALVSVISTYFCHYGELSKRGDELLAESLEIGPLTNSSCVLVNSLAIVT